MITDQSFLDTISLYLIYFWAQFGNILTALWSNPITKFLVILAVVGVVLDIVFNNLIKLRGKDE